MRHAQRPEVRWSPLAVAVQALKVSRQPEHTVAPLPCGFPSKTGAMFCEEPAGHSPMSYDISGWGRRLHYGRAANGSIRAWWEYGQESGSWASRGEFR